MRRRIRLTEGQLMDIIEEATMRVIQEAGLLRGAAKLGQKLGVNNSMFQRSNNANQNQGNSMFQRSNQNQNANQGGGGAVAGILGNAANQNQGQGGGMLGSLVKGAKNFQRSNNSMFQRSNTARGAVNNAVRQAGQSVSRLFGGK